MKNFKNAIILLAMAATLTNCNKSEKENPTDFTQLTKDFFGDKNRLSPLDATLNGQSQYNGDFVFEMTDGYRNEQRDFFEKYQKALASVDTTGLSAEEKISYHIIEWETKNGLELLKFPTNLMPVNQFWGTYLTMGQFAGGESAQPFKTEKDYRNFLSRMEKFSVWIDSAMVYMKKGVAQKITIPKVLTEKTIPQFEGLISEKPEESLFYTTIKNLPAEISEKSKKELAAAYAKVISEKLNPKLREITAYLKTEYLPACRTTSGIGALPFGPELYKAYVKNYTTTEMTPDEIHELGLKEVARLRSEMQKVMDQVGFKGTIQEFCDYVRNKPELKPYKTPE